MCCQGLLIPLVFDRNGNQLDMGNQIRLANRAQRRALRAIYRTCAFPGCDVPFHRTEAHHIWPWELGGPTDLINLLPLCARHHHLAHEGGWSLQLAPDRTLTVYRPDGELHATTGIQITPRTPNTTARPRPATTTRRTTHSNPVQHRHSVDPLSQRCTGVQPADGVRHSLAVSDTHGCAPARGR